MTDVHAPTFCSACGGRVGDEAFCGQCGRPVAAPTLTPTGVDPYAFVPPHQATPKPPLGAPVVSPTEPGAAGPGSTSRRLVTGAALGGVALLLAVLALAGQQLGWFGRADPTSASSSTVGGGEGLSVAPTPTQRVTVTAGPAPVPTPTLNEAQRRDEAYRTLEALVASDAAKNPVRGQWVATLASKNEFITDTSQQAEPFTLEQILAEIRRLQADPRFGSTVRVIHNGDWQGSQVGATPMWVTFADVGFGSQTQAQAWCESTFTERGDALANICYVRQLIPK